jgi:broad specificity phosphatase PhoE
MGSEFVVSVTPLPLLSREKSSGELAPVRYPRVEIFPHLCEQSSRGAKATAPLRDLAAVPRKMQALFPEVRLAPALTPVAGNELAYQDSDLEAFLAAAWPRLKAENVLVTHRNFLKNEVLARAFAGAEGKIPNAAVVRVDVRRGHEDKTIYFVRHCTSHHNAARRGDGFMTTCASLDAVRTAAAALRRRCGRDVLFGSSIMPRAILSCVALQTPVSAAELERLRRVFQPEAAAEPWEVEDYQRRHACGPEGGAEGSFCRGGRSTFILTPKRGAA